MKTTLTSIAAGGLLATLAIAQPPRYAIHDLGPVGDFPNAGPVFIRNNGLVAGGAAVPGGATHAVLWFKGSGPLDIGSPGLGGPNNVAFGVNERGQFVGEAETLTKDSEDFCAFQEFGSPSLGTACVPFLWQAGMMFPLPTLGGNNGAAEAINNRGDVAGFAETPDPDPSCRLHQFKPVIWRNGKARQLELLKSAPDRNGFAYGINDLGQAVGASGDCSNELTANSSHLQALHALLWQPDGAVNDLGNLGGTGHGTGIWAITLNNRGHVVGASDLSGDEGTHAFLWTKEAGMRDLGTLPGDFNSGAIGINDGDDVVGISIGEPRRRTRYRVGAG